MPSTIAVVAVVAVIAAWRIRRVRLPTCGGPPMEEGGEAGECPGPVRVRVEGNFPPGDHLRERFAFPEPRGNTPVDQCGPSDELRPVCPTEQRWGGHVDARGHERRPHAFGEVFQQVGGLGAGVLPVGVRVSADIEFIEGLPKPYRARVRWSDAAARKRPSVSLSWVTGEESRD
ncbi:hypothetical protein [Embleya sp. NPDC059259]|uniref:hypothetical protein n=1 Tax=unclassified Embleya TaxID=2699296 RepID=UPI00369FCE1A